MNPSHRRSRSSSRRAPSAHGEVFDSAIDSWVAFLLLLGPAGAAVIGAYLFFVGQPREASILFATAAFTLILTIALTLPCRYTLLDDALSVRCGLLVYQIPFDQIRSVEPSASLRSGPALSLRRVAVRTDKKSYLLSPKQRDEFIEKVNHRIKTGTAVV